MADQPATAEITVSKAKDEIIKEAKRIEEALLYSSKGHFEAARLWSGFHLMIGIPVVVVSAIAGATAFARFDASHAIAGILSISVAALSSVLTFLNPNAKAASHQIAGSDGKEGTVFVDVIKLVDSPERIVSAFVWFEPVDLFYRFRSHSLYFSSFVGFVLGGSLRNGKFDLPEFFIGKTRRTHNGEMLCEVVKRRSEVVNHISSNGNDIEGKSRDALQIGRSVQERYGMGRDIKIDIANDYVRVFEGQNLGCQITQVLLGPFDLYANQNNSVDGLKRHSPNDSRRTGVAGGRCCRTILTGEHDGQTDGDVAR
jgi:hypothetical protein